MAALPEITGPTAILKEAFPDTDVEIIEIVLQQSRGDTEAAFNQLLAMSDPSFNPEPLPSNPPPTSLPLPADREGPGVNTQGDTLAYQQPLTSTPADQLAADEALARALATEGFSGPPGNATRQPRQVYYQQQEQDVAPQFNLQEELEPLKQKAIEGAMVAKKKVLEFYNQIKNKAANSSLAMSSTSPSSTTAQYRNLPDDEDFLSADQDLSALRLSDSDVATRAKSQGSISFTPEERLAQQQAWIQIQREKGSTGATNEEEDRLERHHSPPKGYSLDEVSDVAVLPVNDESPKELPTRHHVVATDELIDDDEEDHPATSQH